MNESAHGIPPIFSYKTKLRNYFLVYSSKIIMWFKCVDSRVIGCVVLKLFNCFVSKELIVRKLVKYLDPSATDIVRRHYSPCPLIWLKMVPFAPYHPASKFSHWHFDSKFGVKNRSNLTGDPISAKSSKCSKIYKY